MNTLTDDYIYLINLQKNLERDICDRQYSIEKKRREVKALFLSKGNPYTWKQICEINKDIECLSKVNASDNELLFVAALEINRMSYSVREVA